VGMGVLPLQFKDGENCESLGLDGSETFTLSGVTDMSPRKTVSIKAVKKEGTEINFEVVSRLNTNIDVEYFEHGGILPCVLRNLMRGKAEVERVPLLFMNKSVLLRCLVA